MNKKLLMSLAPLLAVAAFALAPTAAQAAPHWYDNGAPVGPSPGVQVITWGKLTLTIVKGGVPGAFVTCKVSDAGNVWNPEPTATSAGEDAMLLFAFYECESEGFCPAGFQAEIAAENLPWPTLLTEEVIGTIRDEIKGMKLVVKCVNAKKVESETKFTGKTKPNGKKGTGSVHPGFLEFDGSSGELEVEGSGGTITAKLEGVDKILGFNAQEVINMKNP